MTPPATPSKVILIADRRSGAGGRAPVVPMRRYRLARVRLDERPADPTGRFGYLKRSHD